MDALTATKYKSRDDDSCLFQSLYSRKGRRDSNRTLFTFVYQNRGSSIKQMKLAPSLNSAYTN